MNVFERPRRVWFSLFFLGFAGLAWSADVSLTAEADKTEVRMDDTITLRVTLSGGDLNGARPVPPQMPGFRAAFAGQSQNISFVNGKVSSEISFTYVLQPLSPGDRTIPPFTVTSGGRTFATSPIAVKVLPAASGGPTPPAPSRSAPAAGGPARALFLTASVDKTTVYVGQPLTLSVRFYSRVPLLSQPAYAPPPLTGFLSEDLPPQNQFIQPIDGRKYSVIELKTALFPASPGVSTVGPAALECRTEDFSNEASNDPFDSSFFQNFFSNGRQVVLRSDPLKVRVLPLPSEGRPTGFRGDVGRYRISAAVDRSQTSLHEPVTLTVTVAGEGNINALSTPEPPSLTGFKTYETLSSLNIEKTGWKVHGSKVFKTVLKPEVSGRLPIPAYSFSFFDPEARSYRTVQTEPLSLTVAPGEESAFAPAPLAADVRVISQDVRYLKAGPLIHRRRPFGGSLAFWLLNLFPGAAFLFFAGARTLRHRPASEDAASRRARATARRALKEAEPLLRKGDAAAFLSALEYSLRKYWSAKTSSSAAAVTWEEMSAVLVARAPHPDLERRLRELWDGLLRARYTPGLVTPEDARAQAAAFERLLPDLEALWK